ncbi:response regulator transcription factor [Corynebacterium heidelbergense]|uniref:DNA-binding response regulator n=1 Tax=Corynebacterium heidelbergense TaxID=2055947 RepID=A0A364VC82_9CORY|nr:response regulator transcription factor [Corynebacterium heidelbergense]RAV34218.1 DNA-binding response regulator [Corynebacterium heidelbergense]WCZ35815.1 Transcriptional regulatory protein LiaR [Corynebacterium heidelbergense]
MPIRVLLADDQPLLLSALSTVLNASEGIEVVATARDGREAIDIGMDTSFDVAVLDIRMPRVDGIEALRQLLRRQPGLRGIMLTTFDDEDLVQAALVTGAQGFILKDTEPEELAAAVRKVFAGESVLDSSVTGPVLETFRAALDDKPLTAEQEHNLRDITAREREVLVLVSEGLTNMEIAENLHVAETTVKSHVSSLLRKLKARDRVALALIPHRTGFTSSHRRT